MQEVLERISDLICDIPDLHTLDIDNVFVRGSQLWACSICLRLTESPAARLPQVTGYRHMAIHPYPTRLVQARLFGDGAAWTMRPIRPEDAESLTEYLRGLSAESQIGKASGRTRVCLSG